MMRGLRHQRLLALFVLVIAVPITWFLSQIETPVEKSSPTPRATPVEVIVLRPTERLLQLEALGIVEADRQVTLTPEVTGLLIERSEQLVAGALVKEGELLLRIDPTNYQVAYDQAKAQLQRARFELQQEKGRKLIAEREWELLAPNIQANPLGKSLALREPQLVEKAAAVQAARSQLKKARRDLERTEVRAPFDAVLLELLVEKGQLLSPQTPLLQLVGIDRFRIRASLPLEELYRYKSWGKELVGAPTQVKLQLSHGLSSDCFCGYVAELLSDLDSQGRMARLLVIVDEPLRKPQKGEGLPLFLGAHVRLQIEGERLSSTFSLPREALHAQDLVYLVDSEGRLKTEKVVPLAFQGEEFIVVHGFQGGEKVITTPLSLPIDGMLLEVVKEVPYPSEKATAPASCCSDRREANA